MSATDARERELLDSQFGSGTPATWFFGVSTTTSDDAGGNFTEPVGGSYARVAVTNNVTNFPAATTVDGLSTKTNGTAITWPTPTAAWGTALEWGAFTTLSGGVPAYTNPLDDPVTIQSGNTPVQLAAGALVLPCD